MDPIRHTPTRWPGATALRVQQRARKRCTFWAFGLFLMLILLALVPLRAAHAQAVQIVAGSVASVEGRVVAERAGGVSAELQQGSMLLTGDIVVTQRASRAELKMSDGAVISLAPNSRLQLNDYRMTPSPEDASSVMTLVQGGLRTVTGWIGKLRDDKQYRTQTPAMMIGVRGTDYSVEVDGRGVRVQVHDGAVAACNAGGCVQVAKGQAAQATSQDAAPVLVDLAAAAAPAPASDAFTVGNYGSGGNGQTSSTIGGVSGALTTGNAASSALGVSAGATSTPGGSGRWGRATPANPNGPGQPATPATPAIR